MLFRKTTLISSILLCIMYAVRSYGTEANTIALILSMDPNTLNTASVDFFQTTRNSILATKTWRLSEDNDVLSHLPSNALLKNIPVLPRHTLLNSYPINQSKDARKMIPNIQKTLDTLAISGAVLVDCTPDGKSSVSACRLFYYDRTTAKITASSQKDFVVPIDDATRWSPILIDRLQQGISEESHRREQNRISKFMQKPARTETSNGQLQVGIGIYAEYHKLSHSSLSTLSGIELTPAWYDDGHSIGLELSYGTEQGDHQGTSEKATKKSLGLSFTTSSKALDILVWELGISGGFSTRSLTQDSDEVLVQKQPFIAIRPGLLFSVKESILIGVDFRSQHYFGGNKQRFGSNFDGSFSGSTLGFGFNLKLLF